MSRTIEAAHGRWREILPVLGVSVDFLNGKHQPCPLCGGKDRARFTDLNEQGGYFCNQCGAGSGMQLLMKLHGWNFATAAKEVDKVIGNLPKQSWRQKPSRKHFTSDAALNAVWNGSTPVNINDPVGKYFRKRGLIFAVGKKFNTVLRHIKRLKHPNGQHYPAMLAKFSDAEGKAQQIQKTFLADDGEKASAIPHRQFMARDIAKGGAVRLLEAAETMGVAEGVETALSAALLFDMPVWATTSDSMLAVWEPPLIAQRIIIFGDNDKSFAGQAASAALAKRLVNDAAKRGIKRTVEVRIPDVEGFDWNDVLMKRGAQYGLHAAAEENRDRPRTGDAPQGLSENGSAGVDHAGRSGELDRHNGSDLG